MSKPLNSRLFSNEISQWAILGDIDPNRMLGEGTEATILRNMWNFPTISLSYGNVAHYLMCVVGNGYDWTERGTLVSSLYGYEGEINYSVPLSFEENFLNNSRTVKLLPEVGHLDLHKLHLEEVEDLRVELRDRFADMGFRNDEMAEEFFKKRAERKGEEYNPSFVYPPCGLDQIHYHRMFSFPKNITEDWADLIRFVRDIPEVKDSYGEFYDMFPLPTGSIGG